MTVTSTPLNDLPTDDRVAVLSAIDRYLTEPDEIDVEVIDDDRGYTRHVVYIGVTLIRRP